MLDYIIIILLCISFCMAARYIYREKKKGRGCAGCLGSGCNGECKHLGDRQKSDKNT